MHRRTTHIHLIGIGGIGMSGIATILKHRGYEVTGCDKDLDQQSVKNLLSLGCKIYHGNNNPACHIPTDVYVYSSAISPDNPEIIAAQQAGIPTIPRALMLAELMRTKYSIAVAGTHGKTTVTSLISHILIESGLDPTVIIGGHLKAISNNARHGNGEFLVAEADESDRSFLHLYPTFALVTNVDLDHVDTYASLDDVKQTFKQFLHNIPFYGKSFLCSDNAILMSLLPIEHIKTVLYGTTDTATLRADNIVLTADQSRFDVYHKNEGLLGTACIYMAGHHTVLNSLGAIAVALDIGLPFTTIVQSLATFKGVDRRFSYRGQFQGALVFDDYGHHPEEIRQTMKAASLHNRQLVVVFQPHRYSRTKGLWNDFITCFVQAPLKHLIITDIYAAGEQPYDSIHGQHFSYEIQKYAPFPVTYVPTVQGMEPIQGQLAAITQPEDLILLLGAGSIGRFWPHLIQ